MNMVKIVTFGRMDSITEVSFELIEEGDRLDEY